MNLVVTVLEIVAPVFLLASMGFAWIKLGFEYRIQFVTRLATTVATPALIFVALMTSEVDPAALRDLALGTFLSYGGILLVAWAALRIMGLRISTYLAPLVSANTGNLGLPLALFAFGETGLGYAVAIFGIIAMLSFTVGVYIVSGGGSLTRLVREPIAASTLLGALFLWQGWETPEFLTNTLRLLGQMAIPMMLLTLGVAVASLSPGRTLLAVGLSVFKLIICVSISWMIGTMLGLDDTAFAVLVLQMSTPVAVTSYLLAEKYGGDSNSVAGLVLVSTLISVIALPVLLGVLL